MYVKMIQLKNYTMINTYILVFFNNYKSVKYFTSLRRSGYKKKKKGTLQ